MPKPTKITNRFDNFSAEMLADEIGRIDAILKAAENDLKEMKAVFKARGLEEVSGDSYLVTATDQTSWRLDTEAVRAHLGALASKFEKISTSTVIRIKPNARTLSVAA